MKFTLFLPNNVQDDANKFQNDHILVAEYEKMTVSDSFQKPRGALHPSPPQRAKAKDDFEAAKKTFLSRLSHLLNAEKDDLRAANADKRETELAQLQKEMHSLALRQTKFTKHATVFAAFATGITAGTVLITCLQLSEARRQNDLTEKQNKIMVAQNEIAQKALDLEVSKQQAAKTDEVKKSKAKPPVR